MSRLLKQAPISRSSFRVAQEHLLLCRALLIWDSGQCQILPNAIHTWAADDSSSTPDPRYVVACVRCSEPACLVCMSALLPTLAHILNSEHLLHGPELLARGIFEHLVEVWSCFHSSPTSKSSLGERTGKRQGARPRRRQSDTTRRPRSCCCHLDQSPSSPYSLHSMTTCEHWILRNRPS